MPQGMINRLVSDLTRKEKLNLISTQEAQGQVQEEQTQKKASKQRNSSVRRFLLLTLNHAERRENVNTDEIIRRLWGLFVFHCIVLAKELHKADGYHFHVGILNSSAQRYSLVKKVRRAFPE